MPEHAADGRGAGRAPDIDLEINAANLFGKLIQKKAFALQDEHARSAKAL